MNPIKTIRTTRNITQHEFANIAGVGEQVVMKTELGLYPNIPPSVLRVAAQLGQIPASVVEADYQAWIKEELRSVKLPNTPLPKTPKEFIKWRHTLCGLNDEPDSQYALARLLKLNPYVIQKYEAGKMKQTPLQIAERVALIRGDF